VAEIKVKMAIDPFQVIGNALACARKRKVPEKIVSVDYDDEADVLYSARGTIMRSQSCRSLLKQDL
jgi:flavoprotein